MNEFLEFCGIQWWWILLVIIAPIIFLILANAFDIRGHETIACGCFLLTFISVMAVIGTPIFFVNQYIKYDSHKEYIKHITEFDASAQVGTQIIKVYKSIGDFNEYNHIAKEAGYKINNNISSRAYVVEIMYEKVK